MFNCLRASFINRINSFTSSDCCRFASGFKIVSSHQGRKGGFLRLLYFTRAMFEKNHPEWNNKSQKHDLLTPEVRILLLYRKGLKGMLFSFVTLEDTGK